MKNNKFKEILKVLIGLIIYEILLNLVMDTVIKEQFTYALGEIKFSNIRFIMSILYLIIYSKPIYQLFKDKDKISSNIIMVLFIFYYIPSWVYYTWYNVENIYALTIIIHSGLLVFANNYLPEMKLRLKQSKKTNLIFYSIVFCILSISIFVVGYYNRFQLHFSLDDVYELREEQLNASLPTIVRYIQPICGTIIPFFIVYFLDKKKYLIATICIITQLLIFSFGGLKTYLFYIICALGCYIVMNYKKNTKWFLNVISLITGGGVLEYLWFNKMYIVNYVIRRVMIVPAAISTYYFDFFTNNSPDYWGQSILKWFGIQSKYTENIAYMIGRIYLNDESLMANNGMIGDAFANFSWIGLIIFPILLAISFKFMNACAKGINYKVTFILAIIYGMNFTNGAFWARMLTNGFILACVILLLLPRNEKTNKDNAINNKFHNEEEKYNENIKKDNI